MAFALRRGRGDGRYLEWKIRLFFTGAVLLLVGMAREISPLVGIAIVVLAAAFLLRFFEHAPPAEPDQPEEPADDDPTVA